MKTRKLLIILGFFVIIIFIIFMKNNYKKIKFGNNENNKSVKDIESYILSCKSYCATIEVEVVSNKNSNKYIMKQEYSNYEKKQTIVEPENIEGVEIRYYDGKLEINNSKLRQSEIYEGYPYLSENILWLDSFVNEYKNGESRIYEENGYVVMETKCKDKRVLAQKKLYINKAGIPQKMEIEVDDKKGKVYILYREIIME